MRCKKVYDVVGDFVVYPQGYAIVKAAILLPYITENGKQKSLSPEICNQIVMSSGGFNAILLVMKCGRNNSSLRNEEVKHYFPFELTIKKEALDFTNGKKLRVMVVHDNKWCEDPDPDIIECTKNFVKQAMYLEGWNFDSRKCGDWIIFHGPKRSGGSVLVGE
ncbi:hypothetical protein LCGC14_0785700 [marine sediment metagenome]|uniref:Uncharacterized protein n=1 Tax=marine sediment metagenome TaxID=412755 RepID=A0A0F9T154_9ZZZZ|nr:hypothetical protein [Maribacter sp.]HDZ03417.1 hypothetical protein [Maribacter sp.]